jgi:broad specificity phosphatase PhoE
VSTLLLVRHGQASFGAAEYDVLSPLGHEQARALGRHLAARPAIDAIYRGPAARHRDTLAGIAEGAAAAGVMLPPATTLDALDEYPAIELLRRWLPVLRARDPALAEALGSSDPRRLQPAYETIIDRWTAGELDEGVLERYPAFVARVEAALRVVVAREGRGRRVLVVTSGGPIALAMRLVLGLADRTAMRLAWVVANGSITELRYRDAELALLGFNATPHLDDRTTTYR